MRSKPFLKLSLFILLILSSVSAMGGSQTPLQILMQDWTFEGERGVYLDTLKHANAALIDCNYKIPTLTDDEKVAVATYTNYAFNGINPSLRNQDPVKIKENAPLIKALDSALAKLPKYSGVVFRRVELPDNVLANYQVGLNVSDFGYMSTSYDPLWPTKALKPEIGKEPNLNPVEMLRIKTRSGARVECLSYHPDEKEVLIPRETKFIVTIRTPRQGLLTKISLNEVEVQPKPEVDMNNY
jgi:hypothetical protein